jgi:hypothetical protein
MIIQTSISCGTRFALQSQSTSRERVESGSATHANVRNGRQILASVDELSDESEQSRGADCDSVGDGARTVPKGAQTNQHNQSGRNVNAGQLVRNVPRQDQRDHQLRVFVCVAVQR